MQMAYCSRSSVSEDHLVGGNCTSVGCQSRLGSHCGHMSFDTIAATVHSGEVRF